MIKKKKRIKSCCFFFLFLISRCFCILNGVLLTSVTSPTFPLEQVTITVQTVVTPAEEEVSGRETLLAEADVRVIGTTVFDVLFGGVELDSPSSGNDGEGRDHPPETLVATSDIVGVHVGVAQKRETSCTTGGHFFEMTIFV